MTTPGSGEFRFATNIEQVRQQIEANLQSLARSLSQGMRVTPQGGQFLEGLNREISQVTENGARKLQQLAEAFNQAQRAASATGTPVQRPGTGETYSVQAQKIAAESAAELQRTIQNAMNSAPQELRNFDFQGLARRGAQEMFQSFQTVFNEVNSLIRQMVSEVKGGARTANLVGKADPFTGARNSFDASIGNVQRQDPVDAARDRADAARAQATSDAESTQAAQRTSRARQKEAQTEEEIAAVQQRRLQQALLEANIRSGAARHVTSNIAQQDGEFFYRSGAKAGDVVTDPTVRNNAQRTVDLQDRRDEINAKREAAKAAGQQATEERRASAAAERAAREAERTLTAQERADREIERAKEMHAAQERLAAMVAAGDARRTSALGGSVVTKDNEVYRRTGERVTNPLDVQNAVALRDAAITREARAADAAARAAERRAHENREGFVNNFLGGLTSRGFANNRGFSGSLDGLFASAGTLTKYQGLSVILNGISQGLGQVAHENLDFIDSQTAFNIALGDGQKAGQGFVNQLSDISRAAGSNVGEALDTAARAVGAFADASDSAARKENIGREVASTASQLRVLTGKELKDATGDLLAISTAYGLVPEQLQQVNDAVVNARRNFSADPGQISQGLAGVAVVAKQAGLSVNEAANIIALATSRMDESGQLAATRLSKVFTIIGGAQGRNFINELNQQLASTNTRNDKGDLIQIDPQSEGMDKINQLAEAYAHLDKSQQAVFANRLGGTANSRELIVALTQINDLNEANRKSNDRAGAGIDEFNKRLRDLTGTLRLITGDLKNIAVGLGNSGFLDIFGAAIKAVEPFLNMLSKILQFYDMQNDWVKRLIAVYLEWAVALRLVTALQVRAGGSLIGGPIGRAINARAISQGNILQTHHDAATVTSSAGGVTTVAGGKLAAAEDRLAAATRGVENAQRTAAATTEAAATRVRAAEAAYAQAVASGGPMLSEASAELRAAQAAYNESVVQGAAGVRAANTAATEAQAAFVAAQGPAVAAAEAVAIAQERAAELIAAATERDAAARAAATAAVGEAEAALTAAMLGGTTGIEAAQAAVADADMLLAKTIADGAAGIAAAEAEGARLITGAAITGATEITAANTVTGLALLRGGTTLGQLGTAIRAGGASIVSSLATVAAEIRAGGLAGVAGAARGLIPRRGAGIGSSGFLSTGMGTATVAAVGAYAVYESWTKTRDILRQSAETADAVAKGVEGVNPQDFVQASTDLKTAAKNAREASRGISGTLINFATGNTTGQASDLALDVSGIYARAADQLKRARAEQARGSVDNITLDTSSSDSLSASLKQLSDSGRSADTQFQALIGSLRHIAESANGAATALNAGQAQLYSITVGSGIAGDIRQIADIRNSMLQKPDTLHVIGRALSPVNTPGQEDYRILKDVDYEGMQGRISSTVGQFAAAHGGTIPADTRQELIKLVEAQIRASIPDYNKLSKTGEELVRGAATRFVVEQYGAIQGDTQDPSANLDAILSAAIPQAQASASELGVRAGLGQDVTGRQGPALKGSESQQLATARIYRDRLVELRNQAKAAQDAIVGQGHDLTDVQRAQMEQLDNAVNAAELAYINAREAELQQFGQLALSKISPLDKAGRLTQQAKNLADQLAAETDPGKQDALQSQINDNAFQQAQQGINDQNAQHLVGVDPRDNVTKAQRDLDNANRQLKFAQTHGATGQDLADATNAVAQAQFNVAQATAQAAIAQANAQGRAGDSASQARASLAAAQITLNNTLTGSAEYYSALAARDNAAYGVRQSNVNTTNSRIQMNAFPGSQVEQAAAAIQVARNNLSLAYRGTQEWYDAQKALNEAQQQYSDAVRQADANMLKLGSDLTDPLAQARIDTRVALRALNEARAAGAPSDVIASRQLDYKNAQNAEERTRFDQRLQDAQTNERLGRISHAAYIHYLQSEHDRLTNIAHRTRQQQEMLNSIDEAMQAANEQMQGQWNLGDIRVPTPYEMKRAIAVDAASAGGRSSSISNAYNNVTINGADFAQVVAWLQANLGATATQRNTTTARKV